MMLRRRDDSMPIVDIFYLSAVSILFTKIILGKTQDCVSVTSSILTKFGSVWIFLEK